MVVRTLKNTMSLGILIGSLEPEKETMKQEYASILLKLVAGGFKPYSTSNLPEKHEKKKKEETLTLLKMLDFLDAFG